MLIVVITQLLSITFAFVAWPLVTRGTRLSLADPAPKTKQLLKQFNLLNRSQFLALSQFRCQASSLLVKNSPVRSVKPQPTVQPSMNAPLKMDPALISFRPPDDPTKQQSPSQMRSYLKMTRPLPGKLFPLVNCSLVLGVQWAFGNHVVEGIAPISLTPAMTVFFALLVMSRMSVLIVCGKSFAYCRILN
jgi:hypothetical protein